MQGATTAIARKSPPEPLRWLSSHGLIKGRPLDYGSGRGCFYDMDCYDPYWRPDEPRGKYDTITCIYVLNVVTPEEQADIITRIRHLLAPNGTAYFAVRRDLPQEGRAGRGVHQRYVVLPFSSISMDGTREIYAMRSGKMIRMSYKYYG